MSESDVLKSIKAFLETKMEGVKLFKNDSQDEVCSPLVHVGWFSPDEGLPVDGSVKVPCVLVGMDKSSDSGSDPLTMDVVLRFMTYDPGDIDNIGTIGYTSLLDFMGRTKMFLLSEGTLKLGGLGTVVIQKPYEFFPDKVQSWPIWTGTALFKVNLASSNVSMSAILNELIEAELSIISIEGTV